MKLDIVDINKCHEISQQRKEKIVLRKEEKAKIINEVHAREREKRIRIALINKRKYDRWNIKLIKRKSVEIKIRICTIC